MTEAPAQYQKPLPEPSAISAPFWEGLRAGELRLQRCAACTRFVFYPRSVCPHCLSDLLEWTTASGRGRIYSYTLVRRVMNPAFASEVPYVFAIVELEEGVRVTTNIVNCGSDEVRVDMPVKATYDNVTPEVALLKFELA
ncbi:MAG TPA: Zn-ribbon domain-containing OB-fold protein [Dehalococcoidia bacterium]|nr:Zn-ribbon domain-containing OB-fold protein [Dehalococcoidia bacterium]